MYSARLRYLANRLSGSSFMFDLLHEQNDSYNNNVNFALTLNV